MFNVAAIPGYSVPDVIYNTDSDSSVVQTLSKGVINVIL